MISMTPTTNRLLLRHTVRRYRDELGLTQEELGAKAFPDLRIAAARNKIALLESAERVPRRLADFNAIIKALKVTDPAVIEDMRHMHANSDVRGRWSGARAVFGEDIKQLVDLEHDAEQIRLTGSELVPGLLQCREYAQALFTADDEHVSERAVAASVDARLSRAEVYLRAERPVDFLVVLSVSCLLRIPSNATRDIMVRQLEHLMHLAKRPNVVLQLVPFETATLRQRIVEFQLLRIPAPGLAGPLDMAYTDVAFEARLIDDKDLVSSFEKAWTRWTASALGPQDSRRFMEQLRLSFS